MDLTRDELLTLLRVAAQDESVYLDLASIMDATLAAQWEGAKAAGRTKMMKLLKKKQLGEILSWCEGGKALTIKVMTRKLTDRLQDVRYAAAALQAGWPVPARFIPEGAGSSEDLDKAFLNFDPTAAIDTKSLTTEQATILNAARQFVRTELAKAA